MLLHTGEIVARWVIHGFVEATDHHEIVFQATSNQHKLLFMQKHECLKRQWQLHAGGHDDEGDALPTVFKLILGKSESVLQQVHTGLSLCDP